LTTRQDIELHNILEQDILGVQQELTAAGLPFFASCGDSIRNITINTAAESEKDEFDLVPLAQLVRQYLEQSPLALKLHRKFKISFSSSSNLGAKPYLNDLGFIVQPNGRFTVVGAGSLGPKPALGIELYENLDAKDVLPLAIAAVEFFAEHGERENRRKARFRHIRENFGDDAFKTELDNRFERVKISQPWPSISPTKANIQGRLLYRLQLPNGNIMPSEAAALADAAEPNDAILKINLEHGLEIYGAQIFELPEAIATFATNPIIVACPGASTCPIALTNGWEVADRIRNLLTGEPRSNVRINISSCPNNCAQSVVADIGLVGIIKKINGKPTEFFRLYKGGGNGQNNKLAEHIDTLSAQDVPFAVEGLVKETKAEK
jgi:sulfite reductase beta subunit-like hemoprotein